MNDMIEPVFATTAEASCCGMMILDKVEEIYPHLDKMMRSEFSDYAYEIGDYLKRNSITNEISDDDLADWVMGQMCYEINELNKKKGDK